jgi:hypothetical protein
MDALDLLLRAYLVALGACMAGHYALMGMRARRTPLGMKPAYVVASVGGFGAGAMAVLPGDDALVWALLFAVVGAGGALVVALAAWRAGVKMCDVMDSAAALKAARQVHAVVADASREARVASEYVTRDSWEWLAAQQEDPRDKKREQP